MLKSILRYLHVSLFVASICFSAPSMGASCDETLIGTKPNRKTLGSGAVLRLKPKLKKIVILENGYLGTEPTLHILGYWPELPLHAEKAFELMPNQQLKTLSPVLKTGDGAYRIKVELLPTGEHAVMYWVDVFNNSLVEQMGELRPRRPL